MLLPSEDSVTETMSGTEPVVVVPPGLPVVVVLEVVEVERVDVDDVEAVDVLVVVVASPSV